MSNNNLLGGFKKGVVFIVLCWLSVSWAAAQYDTTFANNYYKEKQQIQESVLVRCGDIVFLGNSITERAPLKDLFPGFQVINRGIGGDIVWGVSDRLDAILKGQPVMILLLIGINDVGRGIPVELIAARYEQVIGQIRSQSPSTRLVLQTVIPINEKIMQYAYMKGKTPNIEALNKEIIRLGREYELTVVPLFEKFKDGEGFLPEELTLDGIHLSSKGYEKWRAILAEGKIF
jgi:lysophospholipase L1-like esterase